MCIKVWTGLTTVKALRDIVQNLERQGAEPRLHTFAKGVTEC